MEQLCRMELVRLTLPSKDRKKVGKKLDSTTLKVHHGAVPRCAW